jgi:hypothetical protein
LYVTVEEESDEEERRRVGIMRPMMVTKWATLWHLRFSSGTVYVSAYRCCGWKIPAPPKPQCSSAPTGQPLRWKPWKGKATGQPLNSAPRPHRANNGSGYGCRCWKLGAIGYYLGDPGVFRRKCSTHLLQRCATGATRP